MSAIAQKKEKKVQGAVLETKRADLFKIDPRNIVIVVGFNARKTFGDADDIALSKSIASLGLLQPIVVKKIKDTDQYELVDGERRLWAINHAIENGTEIEYVNAVPFKGTEADRVAAMLATGVGQKKLNELEQVDAVERLETLGYTVDQIADLSGMSTQHIYNLKKIATFEPDTIERIRTGEITMTSVLNLSRNVTSSSELAKRVDRTIKSAKAKGKTIATSVDSPDLHPQKNGVTAEPVADSFEAKLESVYKTLKKKSKLVKVQWLGELLALKGGTAEELKEFFTK